MGPRFHQWGVVEDQKRILYTCFSNDSQSQIYFGFYTRTYSTCILHTHKYIYVCVCCEFYHSCLLLGDFECVEMCSIMFHRFGKKFGDGTILHK